MIAKAAILIQQLNNLITEIESQEDRELNELRGQLNAVHKAMSMLDMSDLPIPQGLIETQQKLQSEITSHDDAAVVLAYLASELKDILDRTRRAENARRPAQVISARVVRTGTRIKGGNFVSRDILKRTLIEVLKTLHSRPLITRSAGLSPGHSIALLAHPISRPPEVLFPGIQSIQ